jgi:hypothetical protein
MEEDAEGVAATSLAGSGDSGGSVGSAGADAADSTTCGGASAVVDNEFKHPCPICLDAEEDNDVDDHIISGMCHACGQSLCGMCCERVYNIANFTQQMKCPMCRAPFSNMYDNRDKVAFDRLWKLVHDRSPGRHTPVAQNLIGSKYHGGEGVKQDHAEAFKWYGLGAKGGNARAQYNYSVMFYEGRVVKQSYTKAVKWLRLSADQGFAKAMGNLGLMYIMGAGVEQDAGLCLKWMQRAAEKGNSGAYQTLNDMQRNDDVPYPPSGTAVTVILLTTSAGSKYNGHIGTVADSCYGDTVKRGRVPVLLAGEEKPKAFKLVNLRV